MSRFSRILLVMLLFTLAAGAQKTKKDKGTPSSPQASTNAAAEDISGMYSFLKDGEFVQITLDQDGVSGYISRLGETEADRGEVLDQFFTKAQIQGHDVSFTTKAVHGAWFEFKGRFDRGAAKTKAEDAYYILRGTLTQFGADPDNKAASRSRTVEFKWLGQPDEKSPDLTNHQSSVLTAPFQMQSTVPEWN
ncbi:MAG TPA: hypothetical protein VI636_00495 [Candidatus Angelobacter sp.]